MEKIALNRREFSFLRDELEDWLREGIITDAQASLIEGRYTLRSGSTARWLLNFGAVLIGLGIISFIAANWPAIPRFVRAAGIIAMYAAATVSAYFFTSANRRYASGAFTLLGAFIYGAGIFLIGQMFNYGGSWSAALEWWILGLLPSAFISADEPLMMMIQLLSLISVADRALTPAVHHVIEAELIPLAHIALLWTAGIRMRARTALNINIIITLAFIFIRASVRSHTLSGSVLVMAACGAVLFCISRAILLKCSSLLARQCGNDFELWGLLTLNASLFVLTMPSLWGGIRFLSLSENLPGCVSPLTASLVSAGVLSVLLLLEIVLIKSKLGRLFAVMLTARYFLSYAFDFMPRALVFTLAGAVCVLLALRARLAAFKGRSSSPPAPQCAGGQDACSEKLKESDDDALTTETRVFSMGNSRSGAERRAMSPLKYALCAVLPMCVLIYMTALPAAVLALGTEIKLSARPSDPRDLLRGDYVTLALDIEQQAHAALSNYKPQDGVAELFAVLKRGDDGFFTVDSITEDDPVSGSELYLRFSVLAGAGGRPHGSEEARVSFGDELSRVYVPENTGRELELADRLIVRANIWCGRAVIKAVETYRD